MPRSMASRTGVAHAAGGKALGGAEVADAGKHDGLGLADEGGVVGDDGVLPEIGKGFADAGEIAGFVIDEGDHLQKSFGGR